MQNHHFQTVVMIHVYMHARQGQIVMIVVGSGNLADQIAFMVIVDITQGCDAMPFIVFLQSCILQIIAYQITNGFRAIDIAA